MMINKCLQGLNHVLIATSSSALHRALYQKWKEVVFFFLEVIEAFEQSSAKNVMDIPKFLNLQKDLG